MTYALIKNGIVINIIAYDREADFERFKKETVKYDKDLVAYEKSQRLYDGQLDRWKASRDAAKNEWKKEYKKWLNDEIEKEPVFSFKAAPKRPDEPRPPVPLYAPGDDIECVPMKPEYFEGYKIETPL